MEISRLNLRVYGICLNKNLELLVTDEFRLNMYMTKFVGGGLQLGESTIDCLKRECKEEMNTEITNIQHFYTTDFLQLTTLIDNQPQQLLSIYYTFNFLDSRMPQFSATKYDFPPIDGKQSFRWIPLQQLQADEFTFPIDRHVTHLILQKYLKNV